MLKCLPIEILMSGGGSILALISNIKHPLNIYLGHLRRFMIIVCHVYIHTRYEIPNKQH